jgi:TP901 family phage tail tape measure protein
MPELDRLYYTLGIKTDELEKGIRSAEEKFNRLAGTIGNIAATIGLAFGFKQMIQDIKQLTFNFDQAMRQVWTLTDQTKEEFDAMRQSVIKLSKEGPYSATELANALYQVISAGVDASQAMDFLQLAMKSAQAGATDLFTAVDGLTTVLNAWGLQMKDLEAVSDAIFVAVREGKTTFQELAQSIGIVAPTASQAGVSLEEVLSAVAALTKQGIDTQRAMTSLNYAIQSIIAPSEKAKKTAQNLGIEFNATQLKAMGLAEFLKYVADAANGDTEALRDLFGSVEALRAVFALTGTAAEDFVEILGEIENGAGETEEAAGKMADSLENQFKRLQNIFDAIKLKVGEALTPLLKTIADLGEKFATWIENMSPAERTILAISGALLALIPVIKTATFVWGLLSAVSGSWVAAVAGVAAVLGTLTIAFGMVRTSIEQTADAGEEFTEAMEQVSTISIGDLVAKTAQVGKNLDDARKRIEDLQKASDKLVQLVADYNFAQETGIGNAKELRKEIEELLKTYPQLQAAVTVVGDKYEIQADKVREILQLELQRLDLAIEQARVELEALKQQEPFVQQQEEMYKRLVENTKQRLEATEKLVEKYRQLVEKAVDPAQKQVASQLLAVYEQSVENLRKELTEYSQKYSQVLDLKQQALTLEQKVKALEETRAKTQEKLNELKSGELQVLSTQEKRLNELNELIAKYTKRLEEYKDKSTKAYETDYEMLKLYINEKMNLLRTSVSYLLEQGENEEKIRGLVEEMQKLEEELKQLAPASKQTFDFSEIEKGLQALKDLTDEQSKQVGELIYRQTKSAIQSALARAYLEGNKEAIAKLESFATQLKEFESRYEKVETTEKQKTEQDLQKAKEEIDSLYEALGKAVEKGDMELANKIFEDLSKKLSTTMAAAFVAGFQDLFEELDRLQKELEEKFGQIFEESLKAEDIEKAIERIKDAFYSGYRDLAQSLANELGNTLSRAILETYKKMHEAYDKGDMETFNKMKATLEQLKGYRDRLTTILARDEKYQKALEDSLSAPAKTVQKATESFDDALKKQEKRWGDYMKNLELEATRTQITNTAIEKRGELYEKLIELYKDLGYEAEEIAKILSETIESEAAGTDLETKIKLYEQQLDIFKKLGVSTDDIADKLERLKSVQEEQQKAAQEALEESKRALETERELAIEAAKAAEQRRYAHYNEMLQIQQLRKVATDTNRAIEERIDAYEQILELQRQIGVSEEEIKETEELIKQLEAEQLELERQKEQVLRRQRTELQQQAGLLNALVDELAQAFSQFGEIGELIAAVLEGIEFRVEEIIENGEVIGYTLVNPFERIEELTANIQHNIAQWAIGSVANMFANIVSAMQDMTKSYDKFAEQSTTDLAELLKNYRNFEQNLRKLRELQAAQVGTQIGSTAVGGLIGFFLGGPLGALIGAGIGAAVGTGIAQAFDEQIEEIKNKLKATWQEVKEALGTDIDSVASALQNAFDADTYEDFVSNFSQSLEEMTKQALIKAFLASEAMQPLFDSLSDTITTAVLDGVLTAEEMQAIRQAAEKITDAAEPFFEALQQLFGSVEEAGVGIEHTASESISSSITEETANRLAALLSTINLNVATIKDKLVDGTIRVEVTNLANYIISPREYLLASGG